ncbi:MAG: hypothetical protein Q9174_000150 [Haloplaca sp. 1 TL-2023]
MAWLNVFHRRDEKTCTVWGYTFQQTSEHPSKQDTAAMKMSYDTLGEKVLDRLNTLYPLESSAQDFFKPPKKLPAGKRTHSADSKPVKRDLYVLLRDHALEDEVLERFWTDVNKVPPWVCWNQIERGQQVFYRYGGPALTGLAFQSLLGGMVNCSIPDLCDNADDFLRGRQGLSKHLDEQVVDLCSSPSLAM